EIPASNIKKEIAEILKAEGYVKNVEYIEDDKQGVIRVFLKYSSKNERVITGRSEEHTSELQSRFDLVCRLLLEKKKKNSIRGWSEPRCGQREVGGAEREVGGWRATAGAWEDGPGARVSGARPPARDETRYRSR